VADDPGECGHARLPSGVAGVEVQIRWQTLDARRQASVEGPIATLNADGPEADRANCGSGYTGLTFGHGKR
jgi:hypothetical protein